MTPRVTLAELRRLAKNRGFDDVIVHRIGTPAFDWQVTADFHGVDAKGFDTDKRDWIYVGAPTKAGAFEALDAALRALPQAGKEKRR